MPSLKHEVKFDLRLYLARVLKIIVCRRNLASVLLKKDLFGEIFFGFVFFIFFLLLYN